MAARWVLTEYSGVDGLRFEPAVVAAPGPGEVTIRVTAAGVNPSDYKGLSGGWNADPSKLPLPLGQEAAGVVTAVGPDTEIASGPVAEGDRVVAFKISGGFATEITVPAADVFAIPDGIDDATAGGLLHVGVVAVELVALAGVADGDTVLVHGAAGSVGTLVVQLAHRAGARVIGTASAANQQRVRALGAEPTTYGDGLADRVRQLAPAGVTAAIDAAGTDEALDVSLGLVADPARIATLAPGQKAKAAGVGISAGAAPASIAFRMPQRSVVLDLAARGELSLPIAARLPLDELPAALRLVGTGHAGGKVVLTA